MRVAQGLLRVEEEDMVRWSGLLHICRRDKRPMGLYRGGCRARGKWWMTRVDEALVKVEGEERGYSAGGRRNYCIGDWRQQRDDCRCGSTMMVARGDRGLRRSSRKRKRRGGLVRWWSGMAKGGQVAL